MTATTFRHKCPPEFNAKTKERLAAGEYSAHIRRAYEVPVDAEWTPLYDVGDPRLLKLGAPSPTGRELTVVRCPDCDAEVVVTRIVEA